MLRYSRFITVFAASLLGGCGGSGDILGPGPDQPLGAVGVTASTSGVDPDPDGFTVRVDGGTSRALVGNQRLVVAELAVGSHQVTLGGIAGNCRVSGENPRAIVVALADTTEVGFGVSCSALTGAVVVTVKTTGSLPDPDGYLVSADGGAGLVLGPEGRTAFGGLTVGPHTITLSELAPNCTVAGDNPITVEVTAGGRIAVDFSVSCTGPAPAPGVGQLLFTSDRTGPSHIYRLDVSGGAVTDLTPAFQADEGRWSPDGSKIMFTTKRGGNNEIYVMDADGSGRLRLTTTPEDEVGPVWSPDGSRIAFAADGQILVMDADGSGRIPLGTGSAPAWSPDGALIAFVRQTSEHCLPPSCARSMSIPWRQMAPMW